MARAVCFRSIFSRFELRSTAVGIACGAWLLAACEEEQLRPTGKLTFDPERPQLMQPLEAPLYTGSNLHVLEAQEHHRTGLDLHRNVITRTCGPNGGVCHNQKEYPDLHTPSNFLSAIGAPCNVQPGDWVNVFDGCEQPSDRFRIGDESRSVEVGYIDYIPGDPPEGRSRPKEDSPGLHLYVDPPLSAGRDRDELWGEGRFLRYFINERAQREELTFARFQTQWWLLDGGRHLFGAVQEYQVDQVNELLSVGVQEGDMNRNGVFGAREIGPLSLITPGKPEDSYLVGRLRGKLGLPGHEVPIPGTRMPLANDPLTISDMLALYCFIEGLPEVLSGVYDLLGSSIDYVNCSYSADPEGLNLLGDGASWLGRVKPLLEANCGGCHGGNEPQVGFDVLSEGLYERLLGPSSQKPDLSFITPGDPSRSYLWLKLTRELQDPDITGYPMPIDPMGAGGYRRLSEGALTDIENWILNGALAED